MQILERIQKKQTIRVMGIDDSPFSKKQGQPVLVSGIVCSNTKFEGMVRTYIQKDGMDATEKLIEMITNSKFHRQLHAVLLDGVTMGGFNVVNTSFLAEQIQKPCISIMRKRANDEDIYRALQSFSDREERMRIIRSAGTIHKHDNIYFQCHQCAIEDAKALITYVTETGYIPEPLRIAHLVNSAFVLGQSNKRP